MWICLHLFTLKPVFFSHQIKSKHVNDDLGTAMFSGNCSRKCLCVLKKTQKNNRNTVTLKWLYLQQLVVCFWVSQLSTQVCKRFTPRSSSSWQNPSSFPLSTHPSPLPPLSSNSLSSHCHSSNSADPRNNLSHCSKSICYSTEKHTTPCFFLMLALCITVIVLERHWWKCVCCMHLLPVLVQLDLGGV